MTKKYDSSQNATVTKTYCQDYEVALTKIKCDFQGNESIDIICILIKRDDKPENLILTQIQMI